MSFFGRNTLLFSLLLLFSAAACANQTRELPQFTPSALLENQSATVLIAAQFQGQVQGVAEAIIGAETREEIVAQINAAPDIIVAPDGVYVWQLITPSPWFASNYIESERVASSGAVVYERRPSAADLGERMAVAVDSGRGAGLVGYALSSKALLPDEPMQVSLFWRADGDVDPFVTVLRGLSTVDGALVAQSSERIPRSLPADFWQEGEVIEERFVLEAVPEATIGSFEINVGLHAITNTVALPLTRDGDDNVLDKAVLDFGAVPWTGSISEGAVALGTELGDGVVLLSAELKHHSEDNQLQTTLYWQPTMPIAQNYVVFVHLFDASGNFIANHDSPPRNASYITRSWEPGVVVEDVHPIVLPDGLTAGTYVVKVGMYDGVTQERLAVIGGVGANSAESTVTIGEIILP